MTPPKHSKYSELVKIIEEIVLCQDCGGYVSDHQGVLGDCNYEAGQEIVDDTVTALTTLITKEKAKAERAVVERVKLHKDHPLLSPAKRRDANNTIDYIVADLEAQLTKDKEKEDEVSMRAPIFLVFG